MVEKLFRIRVAHQQLFLISPETGNKNKGSSSSSPSEDCGGSIDDGMDDRKLPASSSEQYGEDDITYDDDKDLAYFNLSSLGWKVRVDSVSPEDIQRAKQVAAEMASIKLQQQEVAKECIRKEEKRLMM